MSIGKTLLAAAATVSALAALPAAASAYTVDYPGKGKFTVAGTAGESTIMKAGETQVSCSSVTGEGEFFSPHKGSIELALHGCKDSAMGTNCTTTGSPAGTVTTTTLPFHVVKVTDPTGVGHPGVLITPGSGETPHFGELQMRVRAGERHDRRRRGHRHTHLAGLQRTVEKRGLENPLPTGIDNQWRKSDPLHLDRHRGGQLRRRAGRTDMPRMTH